MKTTKFLLSVLALTAGGALFAQMPEIKGAEQLIRQNPPSILEAKKSIDKATEMSGVEAIPYYWFVRGWVYTEFGSNRTPEYVANDPQASEKAVISMYKFYTMADEKSLRKYRENANAVLPGAVVNAYNRAYDLTTKDSNYKASLEIYDNLAPLIKYDNEHDQVLKAKVPGVSYNTVLLLSYVAADKMNDNNAARNYLQKLIDNKYADPKLYIYMSRTYEKEGNTGKQLESIKSGRVAYPNNKDVISEEINYYIQNDKLIILKQTIDKEIEGGNADANFYFIRGYINDQIGVGSIDVNGKKGAGKVDTAYLRGAQNDYLKTLELNSNSLDATFNLGVLHTTIGNYYYETASKLPYSETVKFDALKKLETENFNKAIEYFEMADGFSSLSNTERIEMYGYMKQLYGKTRQLTKIKEMDAKIDALKMQK